MHINRYKLMVAMAKKDLTALQLAELAKISRATVSNIRCGKTCSDETGQAIAKALGVDVTELMEG